MTSSVPDAESKNLLLLVMDWDGNLIKAFRPAGLTSYSEISCSAAQVSYTPPLLTAI